MPTDNRFVFENRPLGEWLLQVVDEDGTKRERAAKVVINRFFISAELILKHRRDAGELRSEFIAAVQAAVRQPGFPALDFVRNVLALEIKLQGSWSEKIKYNAKQEKEADNKDLAKLGENPTEAGKRRYLRRVWIRFLKSCKNIQEDKPHEMITTGTALIYVINSLDVELLLPADLLREMLCNKYLAYLASDAIGRMGWQGLEFYDDLLRGLNTDDGNHYCATALGTVLRTATERIPEILELARGSSGSVRAGAIYALGQCGERATEFYPEVEVALREILEARPASTIWYAAVAALGRCARTSKTVDLLLALIEPSSVEQKGEIISALGDIAIEPERVVPVLINMLDNYEEYDPDWSAHGRVVGALSRFGQAAAPAIPTLISHIWQKPEQQWTSDQKLIERADPDGEVIALLGEFGVSAGYALPVLLQVRDEMLRRRAEDLPAGSKPNENDDADSSWNVAIRRIQTTII